jgi:hypothetical protein
MSYGEQTPALWEQDPRVKIIFEVVFKKFHPRKNVTTLLFTKIYLLNTIKPFSGSENRSLGPKQQKPQKISLW